jgi:Zn-dependent protease
MLEASVEQDAAIELLNSAVSHVMSISDVTVGGHGDPFAVRYRGRLQMASEKAYAQLEPTFIQENFTPVFRNEDGGHVVMAVPGVIEPEPSNPYLNLLLFGLTLLSMVFVGAWNEYQGPVDGGLLSLIRAVSQDLAAGLPFAISLFAILVAHESGHYLAARLNQTAVSLPYFIPFPSLFGTMGAFISLKEPPRNKRHLLDIGLAGPLSGLVIAIPVLLIGLSLSEVGRLPEEPHAGILLEGNSLLYLGAKYLVKGELLPAPADYGGLPPVLYWGRYILLGTPVPLGARDVILHPIAWAGWAGLLVTSLNLIPVGQLDGGHLMNVLLGPRAKTFWPFIVGGLIALGFVWSGWWVWAGLIFLLGRQYARPLDEITELDPKRRALAWLGLIVFVLVFIPVPLSGLVG